MKPKLSIAFVVLLGATHVVAQTSAPDAVFKRADKNGDGQVTKEELPNPAMFSRFDLNQDSTITLEEARQVISGAGAKPTAPSGSAAAEAIFRYLDKDNDGAITESELIPPAKRLKAVDVDRDGRITRAEALDALDRYAQQNGVPSAAKEVTPPPAKPVVAGPVKLKASDAGVGRQVADTAFAMSDGTKRSLAELSAGNGLVIAYTSATCPVSKRYAPSLARLEAALTQRKLAFLLVDPFASESAAEVDAFVQSHGFKAPVLHDVDKALTATLGARSTTEVFLLDSTRTLIYRGALDDQYGINYNLDAPRETYLLNAVEALLAGRQPLVGATEAPGCELEVPEAKGPKTEVTYHRDVARILQQNCVQCHHDGGIAPFALDDVAEVTDRAKTIKRVIEQGQMPPWFAAAPADGKPSPWANDCSLSNRDKADLMAWLDSPNRPLGDEKDAPKAVKFETEWSIGKPDLVVQIPKPFDIKAEGYMPYQFAAVETHLTEDQWVTSYEVVPSVREVVHHVIVQVHEKGTKVRDRGEGASGFFAAYVPGNGSRIYPEGFARKLPAGSKISFQIHYTPNGTEVKEQVKIGLMFAKKPPQYEVKTLGITNFKLNIPPGAANHVESIERPAPIDVNVMAYLAHMHVRGKSFKYEVTYPDGKQETLLDIPRYDFNWQLRYELKEPKMIPRGSKVRTTAIFDNSAANKANPDPSKTVRWGQQTYEEMMIGYLEYFLPVNANVASN